MLVVELTKVSLYKRVTRQLQVLLNFRAHRHRWQVPLEECEGYNEVEDPFQLEWLLLQSTVVALQHAKVVIITLHILVQQIVLAKTAWDQVQPTDGSIH